MITSMVSVTETCDGCHRTETHVLDDHGELIQGVKLDLWRVALLIRPQKPFTDEPKFEDWADLCGTCAASTRAGLPWVKRL